MFSFWICDWKGHAHVRILYSCSAGHKELAGHEATHQPLKHTYTIYMYIAVESSKPYSQ